MGSRKADIRPENADWKLERADLRLENSDLWPERPDLRPERPYLRPERPDLRPERLDLRPEGSDERGGTNKRTDGRTNKSPPVFYRSSSPSGPLPCYPSPSIANIHSRATGIADHILPLGDWFLSLLFFLLFFL